MYFCSCISDCHKWEKLWLSRLNSYTTGIDVKLPLFTAGFFSSYRMHGSLFLTLTCLSLYPTYLVIWVDYLSFIVNGFFYGYEFLSVFNQPF